MLVMAGLDPAIYVLAMGAGGNANRVRVWVKLMHDDLWL